MNDYFQNNNAAEDENLKLQMKQIEESAKKYLTREALLRFGTLRIAHPEKAMQVAFAISQMAQSGLNRKVDDAMLKEILMHLQAERKETKIKWQ